MKIRKITCLLMVLVMLLAVSAGCSGSGSEVTTISTVESSGATEPETTGSTEPQVTDPGATETTEPDMTEPDSSTATVPSGTEPTDPAATVPDTPADPTEDPQPTDPVPTEPPVTEPVPTEPAVTEPDPAPNHTHSYTKSVTAPTCTNKGYTTYKCACGDSYKDDYVAAKGHSYGNYKSNGDATCTKDGTKTAKCKTCGAKSTVTDPGTAKGHSYSSSVVKATCAAQGYTLHKCSRCGDSYKDNYTAAGKHNYKATDTVEATMWYEGFTTYTCSSCGSTYNGDYVDKIPQEEFERMVAESVVKYINQFRVEQGDTAATSLPGLTLVAEYRAVQLETNFRHSITDLREALAYYQYGEWVDMTEYGYDGYYTANAKEAIAARGNSRGTSDEIGEMIAKQFLNSAGHWAYVGSSDYPYIGVGISYSVDAESGYNWHCCVLQTRESYG